MRLWRTRSWVMSVVVAALFAVAVAPGGPVLPAPAGAAVSGCDPISTAQCLLPFPDNYFTRADSSTATGLRVSFPSSALPKNKDGKHVNPTDWNRNDGFSPGSTLLVLVPGVDLVKSGVATISDIGKSLSATAPIIVLDTTTNRRVPYWAELDTWNPDVATKAIVIRPAKDFGEGHHIVVGLRNLRDASGALLTARRPFARVRDDQPLSDPRLAARKPAIDADIDSLVSRGVVRSSLYLAWDFTVASAQSLAGGMLKMRDDAFKSLNGGVPAFTVTHTDNNVSADVLRRVQGTFDVPKYLTGTGGPGSRLVLGADGLPVRNGTYHAEFRCLIPRSVVDSQGRVVAARGLVYGHGLLGSTAEIEGYGPFINQYRMVVCATPWIGMASDDIANVAKVISDFSTFGSIPDRLQQSFLNFQFLARLIKDPRGFGSNAPFRAGSPAGSVFTPDHVFFNGNSQGGILGGAVTAISKEWTRAVLGVPAINYSVLLPRSVDFDPFLDLVNTSYPDPRVHTLGVALLQMLWDRGDSDGYAQHMISNHYPGTPNHQVLLVEAFGDHQVANIGTETEARTIGAFLRRPALKAGRSDIEQQFWNIRPIPPDKAFRFKGSVLEVWDFGTPAPPLLSVPPESPTYGADPHGFARNVPAVQLQVSQFLRSTGFFVDVCGTQACHATP